MKTCYSARKTLLQELYGFAMNGCKRAKPLRGTIAKSKHYEEMSTT